MPEQLSEAGRVLSSANETRIRAAHEALSGVLDSLGTGDAAAPPAAMQAGESAGDVVAVKDTALVESGVVDLTEFIPLTNQA